MKTINSSRWSGRFTGLLLGVLLGAGFLSRPVCGASFTWTGDAYHDEFDWFNVTNWNPRIIPSASDTITLTGPVNIPNWTFSDLRLAGGTVMGSFTIGGTLLWTVGTLSSGTVTATSNAVVNLAFTQCGILNGVLVNHGQIIWPAGSWAAWAIDGGQLENSTDGLLDMQLDGYFLHGPNGPGVFNNGGTFRKSGSGGGNGWAVFGTGIEFNNSGTVDLQSGTLRFTDGFNSSGQFAVATNTVLQLTDGTFHLLPGHHFTGPGTYGVFMDSVVIDGPINEPNFLLSSGTLTISNQITGTLLWGGHATLAGAPTIASNGVVKVINPGGSGGFPITLTGVLTNYGLFLWPSNTYSAIVFDNGRMENMSGALMDMQLDGSLHRGPTGPGVLNNWGTFRKSGSGGGDGWGQFQPGFVFDNNGLVDLESGTIYFTDGFTSSGQFYVTTNTAAELTGGTFHFLPGHLFYGPGNYGVFGNVVLDGPITEPNFLLSSGTLTISNQITGTLLWGGHAMLAGEPTIASNGVIKVINPGGSGGFPVTLSGVLTNYGLFLWPSNTYSAIVFDNGRLENMPGALMDVQVDGGLHRGPVGPGVFNNAGTLRKSVGYGGSEAMAFNPGFVFNNTGLVEVQSGTFQFTDGFTSSGLFTVATNTAVKLTGGTFHFLPGHLFTGTGSYGVFGSVVIDGPITEPDFLLAGSNLTMTNQITGTVVWQSGRLNGAPTIASNGVVRYVAGSAQPISGVLTNHGLFLWPAGTYTAIYFSNGRLENMADGMVDLQVDASFHSDGGSAQVNNAGVIRKSAGAGKGYFNTGVGLQNTGLLDIQSGTMQLPGDSLLPGSRLNCGLAGISDYGRIAFPGAAVLNGTLSANLTGGFTPTSGTQFQVISSGGLTGGFTSLNLPNHFFVTNSNNSVFLVVGDGGPVSFVGSACMGTNFICLFQTEAGQSYTVEYNEDLRTTNWLFHHTITGDGSLKQSVMPMTNAPQRFFRVRQP